MVVKIEPSWHKQLAAEWDKPYFASLAESVRLAYRTEVVYPPASKIFAAFDACPFDDVKVVILGQDPYHGEGQANGLCFSVPDGVEMPPSLVNIFKEISAETGKPMPPTGDLSRWARQVVMLIDRSRHLVLTSPHPSPLSAYRGFFGNNHFVLANNYLTQHGKTAIDW